VKYETQQFAEVKI